MPSYARMLVGSTVCWLAIALVTPAEAQRSVQRSVGPTTALVPAEGGTQKIAGKVTSVDLRRRTFAIEGEGQKITLPIAEGQQPPSVGERWTITLTITFRPPSASLTVTKD